MFKWGFVLALLAGTGTGGWFAWQSLAAEEQDESLTWAAEKMNLRITVTERGTLESQKTVNGVCQLNRYDNKIIFIVEEGKNVKKDDVVVRFDSSEIDKEIAEEQIEVNTATGQVETTRQEVEVAKNTGASEIAAAQLELTLAELDLEKYEKGDYLVQLNDLKGKIALAQVALEEARDAYENTRVLVKKGFREPGQLRAAEQNVESAKFNLTRDERTLDVLEKFDHRRQLTEFKAKADEAKRKLERARANATANEQKAQSAYEAAQGELKLQEKQLKEEQDQKANCEIKAEQDGVVAYANEDWWSESRRIREGATVYRRQTVFHLPDMSLMQVKVKIHESEVQKVKVGQKAVIRVEAFSANTFSGTVKSVAQLSESENYMSAGIKEYTTIVTLDETPTVALRPGMTAEVEILVDDLNDVLAVPVQAVTEHKHEHFAYVQTGDAWERRVVELGQSNNRFVVIESGLNEGDVLALDARYRGIEEFKEDALPKQGEGIETESAEQEDKVDASAEESDSATDAEETKDENSSAAPDEGKTEQPPDANESDSASTRSENDKDETDENSPTTQEPAEPETAADTAESPATTTESQSSPE